MYSVQKRDGKITEFNLTKISDAIRLAFEAQEKQFNQNIIDFLALKVTAEFESKIKDGVVAEAGNHDELLAAEGEYFKLYQNQFAGIST